MFDVNAKLFDIAHRFVSKEETRYYLKGVFIEPVERGVALVATDGRRMFIAWDEDGSASEPVILRADKVLLGDCARGDRMVRPSDESLGQDNAGNAECVVQVNRSHVATVIDGAFPDWRSLVNRIPTEKEGKLISLSARYVEGFAKAARDLVKAMGVNGSARASLSITAYGEDSPAVVNFDSCVPAFGLVMPVRYLSVNGTGLMSCLSPRGSAKPEGGA